MQIDSQTQDLIATKLAEKIWQKIESQVEEITCLTIPRLAGMLDLTTSATRSALEEVVDFGPREKRVTLAQAKRLIEARKINPRKRYGTGKSRAAKKGGEG